MRAGDGNGHRPAREVRQHPGARPHVNAQLAGTNQLGVVLGDGAGYDHHVGLDPVDGGGLMADRDVEAVAHERTGVARGLKIGARHHVAALVQHQRDAAHAGAADADKVHALEFCILTRSRSGVFAHHVATSITKVRLSYPILARVMRQCGQPRLMPLPPPQHLPDVAPPRRSPGPRARCASAHAGGRHRAAPVGSRKRRIIEAVVLDQDGASRVDQVARVHRLVVGRRQRVGNEQRRDVARGDLRDGAGPARESTRSAAASALPMSSMYLSTRQRLACSAVSESSPSSSS